MNTIEMSLHRVMAEIKSLEEKLGGINSTQYIQVVQGDPKDEVAKAQREIFITNSKSALDKSTAMIKNLATLKSARNKANATILVTINGRSITIDEALAEKAALHYKQELVDAIWAQTVKSLRDTQSMQEQIEAKFATQIATMFTGTRKANDEEMKVVRDSLERSGKPVVLAAPGLDTSLTNLKTDISEFEKEIDFVLSEVNALNKVTVSLV